MSDMLTEPCERCGAPVVRVFWPHPGKRGSNFMDPEPHPDGALVVVELRLEGTSVENVYVRRVRPKTEHPDRLRYLYHFCDGPS